MPQDSQDSHIHSWLTANINRRIRSSFRQCSLCSIFSQFPLIPQILQKPAANLSNFPKKSLKIFANGHFLSIGSKSWTIFVHSFLRMFSYLIEISVFGESWVREKR